MTNNTRYKKLAQNTAIITIGSLGSKVLVYLLTRLYTAYLTKAEYGIADNITQTATLLIPIISLGIGEAVYRFAIDKAYNRDEVLSSGYAVLLIGCASFIYIIPILNLFSFLAGRQWLVVCYVLTSGVHSICSEYIRSQGRFKLFAFQGMFNTLTIICLNILFLVVLQKYNIGLTGYVLSTSIADFITTILLMTAGGVSRHIRPKLVRWQTIKKMLLYSIPLIPSTICWWITNVSDRYMITGFIGQETTGLYAAANKIPSLMMVLSGIFINAWRNSAIDERNSRDAARFFSRVFSAFSGFLLMVSSGIIAFTKVISFIMLDKSFRDAWIYIPILTFSMIFFACNSFFGSIYVTDRKSVYSFLTVLSGAVTNILLNLWLINTRLGAMGAAIATVISYVLIFVLRVLSTRRMLKFNMHLKKLVFSFLLITVQILTITLEVRGWILWQAICLVLMIALHIVPFFKMIKVILHRR